VRPLVPLVLTVMAFLVAKNHAWRGEVSFERKEGLRYCVRVVFGEIGTSRLDIC
jgi:hypothetical protein